MAEVCESVIVMYAGRVVERAPVKSIFITPRHPYTRGLLNSIPRLGRKVSRLPVIQGSVPAPGKYPQGCRFQERCPRVLDKCRVAEPVLESYSSGHEVACWNQEGS